MRQRNTSSFLVIGLLFLLTVLMTACGDNTDSNSSEQSKNQNSDVTMNSAKGEITIPGDAQRVLAPFHEDALLALDVKPVAKWAIGQTVQGYLEDQIKEVPKIEWNMPQEQVLKHEPDLIILENGTDSYEGSYEDYQKIAPTYIMTEETTNDWRKQIETFGKMFGKESQADKVLNQYDAKVAKAKETLNNAIGDETVAAIWAKGDQFFLFEQNRHSAEVLYSELDINQPELVKDLGKAETQWNPISLEKLSQLKADHVFLLAEENEPGLQTLKDSNVWQSTPAVENGNVYTINESSNWTNKGLIASEKTIDDLLKALAE
ncbi:iron complex transport system substrate-binding protein [Lentibacillus persicus]|uniref:Iron complex transport system substrate-binding protein n=1 Tax=Lentibacillus persicus TaxID=640948 RepID=A0A1I1RZH1_9BACI|nr:ABC transporter substrate-binding protein [Lentibacillus persicus]SFD37718.1 iron complex transport system substrate-binding protein [Lentibacillus persicus]